MLDRGAIDHVARLLGQARRVLFVTGAGVSADSGLPTYRGIGGLYASEVTEEGLPIEDVLSGEMMRLRPQLTWRYIRRIEEACRGATFNRAHEVMALLEQVLPEVWVLTQNVDGLHRQAGSTRVIDIHGDVHTLLCPACGHRFTVADYDGLDPVPACPRCGGVMRPDVVLFNELLPLEKLRTLDEQLDRGFDVVFSVGTSSLFAYIARPVVDAARRGAATVEINPDRTLVSELVDVRLRERAAPALDAIWEALGR